jgi:hypothetical protein
VTGDYPHQAVATDWTKTIRTRLAKQHHQRAIQCGGGMGVSTTIYDCCASAAARLEAIRLQFGDICIAEPVIEVCTKTANMPGK